MSESESISNLILERLNRMEKAIKGDIGPLKLDMAIVKEAIQRIDERIGYMDSFMSGFHSQLHYQQGEIEDVKLRVDILEDRPQEEPLDE